MPTNANAYNSRLTDEALEKRFRDTFRSQGGAELVDDLYASGVIVPVVDFTAAAVGSGLEFPYQTAWDDTTGNSVADNATVQIITNAGFWVINVRATLTSASGSGVVQVEIDDGTTQYPIWQAVERLNTNDIEFATSDQLIVFVASGNSVNIVSTAANQNISASYRQIATTSGTLINPRGFTGS